VKAGGISSADAAERIFSIVRESGLWPGPWGQLKGVSTHHAGSYKMVPLLRNALWLRRKAPPGVSNHLYKIATIWDALGFALQDVADGLGLGLQAARRCLRDYIFDYNRDWKEVRVAERPTATLDRAPEAPTAESVDLAESGKKTA